MLLAVVAALAVSTSFGQPPGDVAALEPTAAAPATATGPGAWAWPVEGPVLRPFDPPETPFGAGHRGIDVAASVGTDVLAPEAGTVAFAGPVGGQLFVTLDHGGGVTSTYSWLSELRVREGDAVPRGATIASTGSGHVGAGVPHLHFGVRVDDVYVDPMGFLLPPNVSAFIRLAPLATAA